MTQSHYVYFEDQIKGIKRLYENPVEIITVTHPDDLAAGFDRLAKAQKDGLYLAGFFSYELGLLLETKLTPLFAAGEGEPLLQFGVFETVSEVAPALDGFAHITSLTPGWKLSEYSRRFHKIMRAIQDGDVYQVNLTFPMHGRYEGTALALYESLKEAQPVSYGGVIALGGKEIISLSPELFFEHAEGTLRMRPMKGTIKRGQTQDEDKALKTLLAQDAKNKAENLMIVDLLRNDLSRLAKPGSVTVTDLFRLETYPSLHTMTSGIQAEVSNLELPDLLTALFPCGSVTGAPKIRAMQIIDAVEAGQRGAYCGALGFMDPDGKCVFNVGIRTLTLTHQGHFIYPVGSGVVSGSQADDEYAECLLKARFLTDAFALIETMGWHRQTGIMWKDLHLGRLQKSAQNLGFNYDKPTIETALHRATSGLNGSQKIRILLHKDGTLTITPRPYIPAKPDQIMRLALSDKKVNSNDALLFHKTTRRQMFDRERAHLSAQSGCDEVLFFNEREEICEGSFTNIFIKQDGHLLTPPLSCGLLPGILRHVLLQNGEAKEAVLTREDLFKAENIYVGNSLRGLCPARLV